MLQQLMTAPGVIEFREVPMPSAKKGQVVVKIMKIGICGSDIHVYHGKHPFTKYPVTQGHEVSGIIHEVGEGVAGLKTGQKVTVQPQIFCGKCYPCTHGKYNLCEELKVMGFQDVGMASHYFAVDALKVTPLPEDMDFDEGAMIEPTAVACHAVARAGGLTGKKVAVIGAGPIGNLVAQAAKAVGASAVMITDISGVRLEKAKECGVEFTYNTRDINFGDAMLQCFGPDKADVIYDCAGNDVTIGQAVQYARKGSEIILVAVFAGMARVDLAVLNDHELNLNTTMMYRGEDYEKAIELVENGKILLRPLLSRTFGFQDYLKAYEYIEQNTETTMKVLIDVQN